MSNRAKRDLEEARKSGVIPPEKDSATGELINPHIPEFMAKAPWYLNQSGPGLGHQRKEEAARSAFGFETYYRRGEFSGQATTYRKGACRNCGSMTHQEKDCVERPRKVGAWKSGRDIAPDEVLPGALQLDWDSKRDRYAGYDTAEHARTVEMHEAAEEERRRIRAEAKAAEEAAAREAKEARRAARKAQQAQEAEAKKAAKAAAAPAAAADDDATTDGSHGGSDTGSDTDTDYSSADGSDADVRESEAHNAVGMEVKKMGNRNATVRNLRVREDTAKYLMNLDTESAFYDPKTRSMREDPNPDKPAGETTYRGDAAWRASGAVREIAEAQLFAWDAAEHGTDVHLLANPTQVELLRSQFAERRAAAQKESGSALLARYGGAEHLAAPPRELLLGQAEAYVEYGPDGKPRVAGSGAPVGIARSRYEEDVHPGNHSSVWGSYYDVEERAWGYACCHATSHGAYCTGAAGRRALADSRAFQQAAASVTDVDRTRAELRRGAEETAAERAKRQAGGASESSLYGTDESGRPRHAAGAGAADSIRTRIAAERAAAAEAAAAEAAAEGAVEGGAGSKRRHPTLRASEAAALAAAPVTDADVEAYHRTRARAGDPMADPQWSGGGGSGDPGNGET